MSPHQGRMWCLVCANVQDTKLHLEKVTWRQPKGSWGILKGTHDVGLWYPKGSNFELIGYSDFDYGGCKIDRMSTSGTCQLLGRSLVSGSSKKQNTVALSTAEAEYISASSCCAQLLWMKATLNDFRIKFKVCLCYVTMRVQSKWHKIRFNIQEPSTLT